MTARASWPMDCRVALHCVRAPRAARVLARLLVVMLGLGIVLLVATPWQQTILGSGRVIALLPQERPQNVESPIDGRAIRWHVAEGQTLRKGDPIVDLQDNDPDLYSRLEQEREQTARSAEQGEERARALEDRIEALLDAQRTGQAAARQRVKMAGERVLAAEQALAAGRAAALAAQLNLERQRALAAKGLVSERSVELAVLESAQRETDLERAHASLRAAHSERDSLESELERTDAEARTRIDEARAQLSAAHADVARGRAELAKADVRVSRQRAQQVSAPMDGTVLRVLGRQGGEQLKAGEPLAVLVPSATRNVVELWVEGRDMPMIQPGRAVRLQFEGWPALQFSGWPAIAVGTFGGRVALVDATDDGRGRFRVLVEPDERDEPWPSRHYLRQGVRANGWVLLDQVPIGWEIWRQFNGFPPVVAVEEPLGGAPGSAPRAAERGAAGKPAAQGESK